MEGYWFWNIATVFALCVLLAGILIPQILLLAYRKKLFDPVNDRKIHHGLIPRLGGIAFVPVIFLSTALVVGFNAMMHWPGLPHLVSQQAWLLIPVFCSLQILFIVGLADDLVGIKYRAKFFAQLICGGLLLIGGVWFNNFSGIFGLHSIPAWAGMPFTVIIVVFLINAINLIDGLDGLASGLTSIACIVYGVTFFILGDYLEAVLSFATLGVLVPFYYYNVFGNVDKHKKIFMGDTGSLTIGLILVVLGIRLFDCGTCECVPYPAVVAAFSPLVVPCFDCVRVYAWRLRHHRPPFSPDQNHIHHRLLRMGFNTREAMMVIVGSSLVLTIANILLSLVMNINILIALDIVVWAAASEWVWRKGQSSPS